MAGMTRCERTVVGERGRAEGEDAVGRCEELAVEDDVEDGKGEEGEEPYGAREHGARETASRWRPEETRWVDCLHAHVHSTRRFLRHDGPGVNGRAREITAQVERGGMT